MKKKIFISIALLLGCEDKTNVSPLVGSWNMVEISGGTFIKLNKTQKIYYQDKKEGIIQVKKYKNGVEQSKYSLTKYDTIKIASDIIVEVSDLNIDSIRSGNKDKMYNLYTITSTQKNEGSMFTHFDPIANVNYLNYLGNQLPDDTVSYGLYYDGLHVKNDTLYRQQYTGEGFYKIDSTEYVVIDGSINRIGSIIDASTNYLLANYSNFYPGEISLTLNANATGSYNKQDMNWSVIDSTLIWKICNLNEFYEPECIEASFKYETNKDELILLLFRDECKEWKVGLCDIEAQKKYGVEKGTLELLWTEITIKLSRNLTL